MEPTTVNWGCALTATALDTAAATPSAMTPFNPRLDSMTRLLTGKPCVAACRRIVALQGGEYASVDDRFPNKRLELLSEPVRIGRHALRHEHRNHVQGGINPEDRSSGPV